MANFILGTFVAIVARCAIVGGLAVILSKIVPRMARNKGYLFVFWFVFCVPFNFVLNYVNVSTLGYHKIGWTEAVIVAFLVATCGTLFGPQPHNSKTR